MNPDVWGPSMWKSLIYIAMGYPDNPSNQEKLTYTNFWNNIGDVLPCSNCKHNYHKHINIYKPDVTSKSNTLIWLCSIYNEVRKDLKKPKLTCDEFINKYTKNNSKNYNILIILILIIIILFIYYYNKTK